MPDIAMRFHKDMLVLSAPVFSSFARQGLKTTHDLGYLTLVEPEAITDALRMEKVAGAQCLVAATACIAPAQLAHQGLKEREAEFAREALRAVSPLKPQHLLVEIGPCGLPLDGTSKASLNENRAQYTRAARAFEGLSYDAFFLNGFRRADDLKCALMGIRAVSDALIFASVTLADVGLLADERSSFAEALAVMKEFGAQVAGFECALPLAKLQAAAKEAAANCDLPLLVQIQVNERDPKQGEATDENPYYCADTMVEAAALLRAEGVQFLRATGEASPAYTGALAATTAGFDVVLPLSDESLSKEA